MSALGLIALGAALALAGGVAIRRATSFAKKPLATYRMEEPRFDPQVHLNGTMQCDGVIFGPLGTVSARFDAEMEAHWADGAGSLKEDFTFATGTCQSRLWSIASAGEGRLTLTAPDVIGTAHGEFAGNALRITYRLKLEADAGGHVLNVTDWIFVQPDGVLINRSEMRKFGLKVGELFAVMRPTKRPLNGEN